METASPGKIIAGRYRLVAQLGQGGMGSVWRAEHMTLRSTIAIKLIDPEIAGRAEMLERFQREAQAAASLRSPHVVQILDYGVDEGVPYIAMELLEGESLAERLLRVGRLSPAETTRYVTHVARALSRAEEAGIVHRDLKPDNVFLVKNDEELLAKVLDFGIAKHGGLGSGKGPTRTGNILGTPGYMSPEQAQGTKAVDSRSDLWALGVIAYECVVGEVPFESAALGDLLLKICVHPIPVPSQHAEVPQGFDAWFARACCRDVDARFQTAKELAEALRAVLTPDAPRSSGSISDRSLDPLAAHSAPTVVAAQSGGVIERTPPPAILGGPTVQSGAVPVARVTVPGMAVAPRETPRAKVTPMLAAVAVLALGAGGALTWVIAGRSPDPPPASTSAVAPSSPSEAPKPAEPPPPAPVVEPSASAPAPVVEPTIPIAPAPPVATSPPVPAGGAPAPPAKPRGPAARLPPLPPPPPPPPRPGPPVRPGPPQPGGDNRLGF